MCACGWIIGAVSFGIFYCGGVTFFLLNRVVIVELLVCFVLCALCFELSLVVLVQWSGGE